MNSAWQAFRSRRQLKACTVVGQGVVVEGNLHVQNLGRISLGRGVLVRSTPAMSHLVTGPIGNLTIGEGVFIGHGAAIASHETIVIGDGATLGPFVMLMDTDFHEAGKHDSAGSTGAIHIGRKARLGARVVVLRGSTIGEGAVVAPGSVVKGDVPAGARYAGNPARPESDRDATAGSREIDIEAVRDVVGHTFGLAQAPAADAARDEIEQWDSLGMLNLLLSLEFAFGVSLGSEAMSRVHSVADLVPILEAAAAAE